MNRLQRTSLRLRGVADSRGGVVGMFAWSFSEALVWPLIPDAALSLLVAARPRRWLPLTLAAVAGTVAGGSAGVAARGAGWTWPLPLTTPRMHAAVEQWLVAGADALAHQPLTGVPYKVFVAQAGEAGIPVAELALATLRYRGPRLLVVALVTAAVAALAWRWVPARLHARVHVAASAVGTVLLLVGLAAVVAGWS